MSKKRLEKGLKKFYEEMDEKLRPLSPVRQRLYLEGLVHAFDTMTRLAKMSDISPLERENFIASAKRYTVSKVQDLDSEDCRFKLDPESKGWSPIF